MVVWIALWEFRDVVLTHTCLLLIAITGEKLVNFLVEPKKGTKWPNKLPRFESRQDAIAVCKDMCKQQFIIRSEKQGKGALMVRQGTGAMLSLLRDEQQTHTLCLLSSHAACFGADL